MSMALWGTSFFGSITGGIPTQNGAEKSIVVDGNFICSFLLLEPKLAQDPYTFHSFVFVWWIMVFGVSSAVALHISPRYQLPKLRAALAIHVPVSQFGI